MTDKAPEAPEVVDAAEGNLGRRAGTPVPNTAPSPDSVGKIIGWIAGGFTLLGGSAGALALIPRTVGVYQNPVIVALLVLLSAILLAGAAGAINFAILQGDSESFLRRPRRWWSRLMYAFLALGCLLVVVSIGAMLLFQAFVLGRAPVARLTMSTAANPQTHSSTVTVNYQADNLSPKTFIIVDVYGFTVNNLDGTFADQPGEHVYRALVGSDANGKADSTIQLELPETFTLVVAETTPDVAHTPDTADKWRDVLVGTSHLCEDIGVDNPRTCAWVRLPTARLPG